MEWFFKVVPSLRGRLLSIAAVMAMLMVALSLLLVRHMQQEIGALDAMYTERVVPLKQLKVVADAYAVNVVDATHKVRNGNFTWPQGAKSVADAKTLIEKELRAYLGQKLRSDEQKLIAELSPLMKEADAAVAELERILGSQDAEALVAFSTNRLYQAIDPVSDKVSAMVTLQLDAAQQIRDAAKADYAAALRSSFFALVVALALGGGLAWLISRRILQSLGAEPRQLREFVTAIGGGDLTQHVELPGDDDTSVAANAERMQKSLRQLVAEMRDRSQELRVSAEEISAGNMDLSTRTEQTAAAMSSASSQLKEVIERVRIRSSNLSGARSMVTNTALIADSAGQQMTQVIEMMKGINDSSRRIGDIIGAIDGIAFQTNILALNAAVEAARAGEAGRGFAVVAGEVRLLAQRSAEAAREIKSLISASMERTDAGARHVDETGGTLQGMVSDVQKLSQLVAEIASGANQDDQDMGQVLTRLAQVEQAVQQNAALVEQMAASSQSLNDQSEKLADAAQGFKV